MMRYKFDSEARVEYLEAVAFYNRRQQGLGVRFTEEVEATIQRILDWPTTWPIVEDDVRRCLTRTFPYGVLYTIEKNTIHIYAVMHCSRRPGYWQPRLKEDGP